MANNDQIDLLKQGTQAWNAWRAKHPAATIDLSRGALRGLDLEGVDLSGADLKDADLRGANLSGANLFKAILDGADLNKADLRGVRFLQCPQLEPAHNWQTTNRDEDLACSAQNPSG